jgi:S1-C subfamily serine protease
MYPGFSGGPLVDSEGRVVGLNTSALSRGAALAVPFDTLGRVVEALLSRGRIRRGYLGVGAQPARLPEGLAKELGQETGLLLVSVEAGSPAEQSGLLMGDTLVTLNGNRIRHLDDLFAALGEEAIGQPVPAKLVRGGKLQDAAISVGERE